MTTLPADTQETQTQTGAAGDLHHCAIESILTNCITVWYWGSSDADKGALQRVEPKNITDLFCLLRNSLPPDASTRPTLSSETPSIHLTTCSICCPLAEASNQLRHQIHKELLSLSHTCNKQKIMMCKQNSGTPENPHTVTANVMCNTRCTNLMCNTIFDQYAKYPFN